MHACDVLPSAYVFRCMCTVFESVCLWHIPGKTFMTTGLKSSTSCMKRRVTSSTGSGIPRLPRRPTRSLVPITGNLASTGTAMSICRYIHIYIYIYTYLYMYVHHTHKFFYMMICMHLSAVKTHIHIYIYIYLFIYIYT